MAPPSLVRLSVSSFCGAVGRVGPVTEDGVLLLFAVSENRLLLQPAEGRSSNRVRLLSDELCSVECCKLGTV
jgi:hypothetical protein